MGAPSLTRPRARAPGPAPVPGDATFSHTARVAGAKKPASRTNNGAVTLAATRGRSVPPEHVLAPRFKEARRAPPIGRRRAGAGSSATPRVAPRYLPTIGAPSVLPVARSTGRSVGPLLVPGLGNKAPEVIAIRIQACAAEIEALPIAGRPT